MDQDTVMNYVVALIVLIALGVGGLSMLFGKLVDLWDAFRGWWGEGIQKAVHYRPVKYYRGNDPRVMSRSQMEDALFEDDEPERTRSNDFPLPAAIEPQDEHGSGSPELVLNAAEVMAIHRMIAHNTTAAKPSKSSTIQAGFGVSRGGSAAYTRASLIYDALFGPPTPAVTYRPRTPEQEALRQQLRLGK